MALLLEEGMGARTLKHVLDEDRAFDDVLVGVELLIVRGDEENHFYESRSGRVAVMEAGDGDGGEGCGLYVNWSCWL